MNTNKRNLNTADLTVGQELVLLLQKPNRWGDGPTEFKTETVTVAKILKTRLVITRENGREERLIVEFSPRYAYRNGEVTTTIEGTKGDWRTPAWYRTLFTVGDEDLAERVERLTAENVRRDAKITAQKAIEEFKQSLSIENAEAAIQALQKYVNTRNKEN